MLSTTPASSAQALAPPAAASSRRRAQAHDRDMPVTSASGSALRRSCSPKLRQRLVEVAGRGGSAPVAPAAVVRRVSLPCAKPCGLVPDEGVAEQRPGCRRRSRRWRAASGSSTVPASRKQVVPLRIISSEASRTPRCSSSSVTVSRRRFSKSSRTSSSGDLVGHDAAEHLERRVEVALDEARDGPGRRWHRSCARRRGRAATSASGPRSTMRPPVMAMAPSASSRGRRPW